MHNQRLGVQLGIAFFALQFPALRTFYKYFSAQPLLWMIATFVLSGIFYYLIYTDFKQTPTLKRAMHTPQLFWGLGAVMILLSFIGFQFELLMQSHGLGSDSANALVISGQRLVRGEYPYQALTYFNNPASPGPGWVMLNLPITVWGLTTVYPLLTPVWVLCCARLFAQATSWYWANCLLLMLFSSLSFWEVMSSGVDIIGLGAAFAVLMLLAYRATQQKHHGALIACAILCGALATTRIVFIYLPFLIAWFIFQHNRRDALHFLGVALVVLLGLHECFYFWMPQAYTPLHLLGKGQRLLSGLWLWTTLVSCAVAGVWMLMKSSPQYRYWLWGASWALWLPLMGVTLGDLALRHYAFATWEGANYVWAAIPVLLMAVLYEHEHSTQSV